MWCRCVASGVLRGVRGAGAGRAYSADSPLHGAGRAYSADSPLHGAGRAYSADSPLRHLVEGAVGGGESAGEGPLEWATQPYAARPTVRGPRPRPEALPAGNVLLFPGQGSQWVGMGRAARDHPAARAVYDIASQVLGWDVWQVCTAGPTAELERRAQVCVLVTSLAALERARADRPGAVGAARAAVGYSAGELAALVWAGALGLEDALRLAELRAAAMAAAAANRPQGMLTLWLAPAAPLGAALAGARQAALEAGVEQPVCQTAIYLYPGCRVVAGDEAALQWLERSGARLGVRRAARLAVGGAYHSALMESTRPVMAAAVRALQLHAPRGAVWSCTRGRRYRDARDVARGIARLAVAPVRWEQTLHMLFSRPAPMEPPGALALGPARALATSLRRVNARAADACLHIDL